MKSLGEIPAEPRDRERPRIIQPLIFTTALVLTAMVMVYIYTVQNERRRLARASIDFSLLAHLHPSLPLAQSHLNTTGMDLVDASLLPGTHVFPVRLSYTRGS